MLKSCKNNRNTCGKLSNDDRLDGKVIIVTGANTGIGKATALNFATRGAKVILACRDLIKANEAKEKIVEISDNTNIVVLHLDLCSLTSVRNFAKEIIATENRLDVLVNNAGIGGIVNRKTEDGIELVLQVNHYAPFLLMNLLIDLLKKSAPSRIIHVSSIMHKIGRLDFDNMNCEKGMSKLMLYTNSKLYNVIASNELARRLEDSGVTSNCLHPGIVKTEIWRNVNSVVRFIVNLTLKPFYKTPEEGAQTTIYLAVSDKVMNLSGKYFEDCKEARSASISQDREVGQIFWEQSCNLVGLKPEERFI